MSFLTSMLTSPGTNGHGAICVVIGSFKQNVFSTDETSSIRFGVEEVCIGHGNMVKVNDTIVYF